MAEVILGIGGNDGDRLKNLLLAGGLLSDKIGKMTACSPIVESEPWGYKSQNWFLNQILIFDTNLKPAQLIKICLDTEEVLGRVRTGVYTDRLMDIDILFYDDQLISEENLSIPHPRLHERLFILKPLEKIRPLLIHPIIGLTVKKMLDACEDTCEANWFEADYSTDLLP